MQQRSDPRLIAVVLGAGLLLTGCSGAGQPADPIPSPTHIDLGDWNAESGGNGIVLLDAPTARATMLAAVREAGAASMEGSFTNSAGRALTVSVRGSSEETVAQFSVDGEKTTVVITEGQAYVRPSTTPADGLTAGEYSCVADDDPALTQWGSLLHPLQTLAEHTADASALGAASDDTVDLILGADGTRGTLSVMTQGAALPVTITRADVAGSLVLEFAGWGEPVEIPDLGSPAGC